MKFAEIFVSQGAPPVSTTPAVNLSPVSMTPVANNGNNIRLLTPNVKKKIYLYVISTTQRCPDGRFFPFARELRISPQIFEKMLNGPNGIFRGLGGN